MAFGEYITDRLFPGFIKVACRQYGIEFTSFSDNWVLRLQHGGRKKWVIGYSFDINSTASSILARDKVASYIAFCNDGVPAIEHYLARSRASDEVISANLTDLAPHSPVVIKPLEGTSGHGVHKFENLEHAVSYLNKQPHTDWAASPWYDIAVETRIISLDGNVLCAYEKRDPTVEAGLKFYNLGRGATPAVVVPHDEMAQLAAVALKSANLRLAAIDIATLTDGTYIVMEINEGIMMEHFARASEAYRHIAKQTYASIVRAMFARQDESHDYAP